jgi:hypothetical protein
MYYKKKFKVKYQYLYKIITFKAKSFLFIIINFIQTFYFFHQIFISFILFALILPIEINLIDKI